MAVGVDARKFDPDGPLPEIPETNQSKRGRERVIALSKRENLTVRQIAGRLGGYGGLALMGTPRMIAHQMEEWLFNQTPHRLQLIFPFPPRRPRQLPQLPLTRPPPPRPVPPPKQTRHP